MIISSRIRNRVCLSLFLFCAALLSGCNNEKKSETATQPTAPTNRIFAVSYPLQFLTEEIAGDNIEVLMPYGDEENPKTARPSREMISQMQTADLIIANGTGATYVGWLATVSLPDSKVVNTATRGLALKQYIAVENMSIVHSHGPEGEHSHPVMASRTWLDPALAKKQANYIAKQLKRVYPEQSETFDNNLESLSQKLDALTQTFEEIRDLDLAPVLSQDAKFKFFSRAAGATDQILTWANSTSSKNGAQSPAKETLQAALEKQLAGFEIKPKFVLVQDVSKLDATSLEIFSSLNIKPVELNPLDQKPSEGDYLSVMQTNLETFSTANSQ